MSLSDAALVDLLELLIESTDLRCGLTEQPIEVVIFSSSTSAFFKEKLQSGTHFIALLTQRL
jgi:SUMO ligase MMS21 Smc5/6 complex component